MFIHNISSVKIDYPCFCDVGHSMISALNTLGLCLSGQFDERHLTLKLGQRTGNVCLSLVMSIFLLKT